MLRALNVAIALETKSLDDSSHGISSTKMDWAARLWRCVEASDLRIEVAMLSGDGQPLITFLLSGGIVRMGLSCKPASPSPSSSASDGSQEMHIIPPINGISEKVDLNQTETCACVSGNHVSL